MGLLLIFIVSLFLGSFYNVIGLRLYNKENIAYPPSHCVKCGHRLGVMDLVPLFSYLSLGGKCRYCKEKISRVYPIGELLTAVGYTLVVWKHGFTLAGLVNITMITVLAISTVTDLKYMEVPDSFFIAGLAINIPLRIYIGDGLKYFIISGLAMFILLYIVYIASRGGLGGADVKLYSLIGLTVGVVDGMASLFYAALIGIVLAIPKLVNKEVNRKTEIPLVPLITLGVMLTYIFNIYTYVISIN